MFAVGALLAAATALSAWLSGRLGGDGGFGRRFVELGYQFLPVAMVSLLLGLGNVLFATLQLLGLGAAGIAVLKAALFCGGFAWSIAVGARLVARQHVAPRRRWLVLLPGICGSLLIGALWYPALFAA
jgi:hypothetical protein